MTSDNTFQNQTNTTNKILAQMLTTLQSVAVVPASTAGAVGSYAMAKSTATVAFGSTVSGSSLTPSNAAGSSVGSALTGTWRCMGTIGSSGDVSLFVRTA